MKFSLLPDWYFCCCIEATPSSTSAFLALLEILDNEESDENVLLLALHELKNMDAFMSIYSLPQVLESHSHPNLLNKDAKVFDEYFDKLFSSLNPTLKNLYSELFSNLLKAEIQNQEGLIKLLQNCAENILENKSDWVTTRHPYFELKDFLPEILLLAFLDNYYSKRPLVAQDFSLIRNSIPVQTVFQQALELKYGRLAFRLAIRIATVCRTEKRETLLSYIWENEYFSPAVEPDLILSTFEVIFLSEQIPESERTKNILGFFRRELLELTWYRSLIKSKEPRVFDTTPLRRITQKSDLAEKFFSFSLVYWQAILCDFCANLAPSEAVQWLGEVWREPALFYKEIDSRVTVELQRKSSEIDEIGELHYKLVDLRSRKFLKKYKANAQENWFPLELEQYIFSPWLEHKSRGKNKDQQSYDSVHRPEVLIRLISSGFTATRLLQKTIGDVSIADAYHKNIASLLIHAYDVLDTFGGWLQQHQVPGAGHVAEQGAFYQLPNLKLTSLAIFGRRQINNVGTGKFGSIPPEVFFSILGDSAIAGNIDNYFYSTVLPETFLNWISNCRLSVTDSASPASKWLSSELVETVYTSFLRNLSQHQEKDVRNAALVARFIGKINNLRLGEQFDWRESGKGWNVNHRLFLLTHYDLSLEDWNLVLEDALKPGSAGAVTRAIERVAVLSNKKLSKLNQEVARKWKGELLFHLEKYSQTMQMDRFIRLRLLELLDMPILKDSSRLQELIVMVLIERGSTFEIKDLFVRLFPPLEDGREPGNATRLEIQNLALKVAKKQVDRNQDVKRSEPVFSQIRDPYEILIALQKNTILEQMLARAIFLCSKTLHDPSASVDDRSNSQFLYENLLNLRIKRENEINLTSLKKARRDIEISEDNKIVVQSSQFDNELRSWKLQSVFFDPNHFLLSINYHDFDMKDLVCFFDQNTCEKELTEGQKCNAAALFIGKQQGSTREADEYLFSLGSSIWICHKGFSEEPPIEPGTFVQLPVKYLGSDSDTPIFQLVNDQPEKIIPLPPALNDGDLGLLNIIHFPVEESNTEVKRGLKVTYAEYLPSQHTLGVDESNWEPNLTRNFAKCDTPISYTVIARSDKKKWHPIAGSFADLLVSIFEDKQEFVILTFVKPVVSADGMKGWLFSKNAGERYEIYNHEICPDAQKELASEIQNRGGESMGLIVGFNATLSEDKPLLELFKGPVSDEHVISLYPELQTPFDDRNIKWKNLLSNNRLMFAERKEGQWYYEIPEMEQVNGFPKRIRVDWLKKPDEIIENPEISVKEWVYDKALIRAEYPENEGLNILPNMEARFFEFVSNIDEGDILELDRASEQFQPWNRGFLRCRTKENLPIHVEVESLTMQPIASRSTQSVSRKKVVIHYKRFFENGLILRLKPDNLPAYLTGSGGCEGFVYSVPNSSKNPIYQVLWKINDTVRIAPLDIRSSGANNDFKKNLLPGNKVVIQKNGDVWSLEVKPLYIHARALWSSRPFDEKEHSGKSLVYIQGNTKVERPFQHFERPSKPTFEETFFEYEGQLIRFERGKEIYANHLAVYRNAEIRNRLELNEPVHIASLSAGGRICLRIGSNYLTGELERNVLRDFERDDKVIIKGIRIRVVYHEHEGLFELRRVFFIRRVKETTTSRYSDEEIVRMNQILSECLELKLEITASIDSRGTGVNLLADKQNRRIRVPSPQSSDIWTNLVMLKPNEYPYIVENQYDGEARVSLSRLPSGQIAASYRETQPITSVESLKEELQAEFEENFRLNNIRFYYVGPEKIVGNVLNTNQVLHRFEFGYGRTALLPESSLSFKEDDFSKANLYLFYGDRIVEVRFHRDASKQNNSFRMNIETVEPAFTNIRALYEQRKKDIVHLLHVTALRDDNGRQIKVNSVEGFNENNLTSKPALFSTTNTKLSPVSEKKLLDEFPDWELREGKSFKIYGRFDKALFEESYGREVFFEHVRLSFEEEQDDPSGEYLQNEEYILLQVTRINDHANECSLVLSPAPGVIKSSVGKAFTRGALMVRRKFSIREELLRRIARSTSAKERRKVLGQLLLVRLAPPRSGKNPRPTASLIESPSRKVSSLIGKLMYQGSLFATVAGILKEKLRIEISPGVYIDIDEHDIYRRPLNLKKGSIVEIKLRKGYEPGSFRPKAQIIVNQAAYSDLRYIPLITRPVVILPFPMLIREESFDGSQINKEGFWKNSGLFNLGGMPNKPARAKHYEQGPNKNNLWSAPVPHEMTEIMRTPHPKLARAGRIGEDIVIAPLEPGFPVGFLDIDEDSLGVKISFFSEQIPINLSETSWRYLTYAQESVDSLMARLKNQSWNYLDAVSAIWKNEGSNEKVKAFALRDHTVFTGPLFFEIRKERLCLRYSTERFLEFGFPVSELIENLLRTPTNKGTFVIAGLNSSSEKGIVYSVWIEIVPGRLVEIPTNLVKLRVQGEGDIRINWNTFAVGDLIEIRLLSGTSLTVEQFLLENWVPGIRRVLGFQKALLPAIDYDQEKGSLLLGAGIWRVVLPENTLSYSSKYYTLAEDNELLPYEEFDNIRERLNPGDTIFLSIHDDHLILTGLDDWTPMLVPGADSKWLSSDIARWFIDNSNNSLTINMPRLTSLLRALGDSLPVTIEVIEEQNRTIHFSMRHHVESYSAGESIYLARIEGFLSEESIALLRSGSEILFIPVSEIVTSLPNRMHEEIINSLKRSDVLVWLSLDRNGNFSVGIDKKDTDEFSVEGIACIDAVDEPHKTGIIVRSLNTMKFYWLPKNEATWADLGSEQLRRLLVNKVFEVRRLENGYVSILSLQDVQDAFIKLTIGTETVVRVVSALGSVNEGNYRFLVENLNPKIAFVCESRTRLIPLEAQMVQVRKRFSGERRLIATPSGETRSKLDLPGWMLTQANFKEKMGFEDVRNAELYTISELLMDEPKSNGNISLESVRIAVDWITKNIEEPEINLYLALTAILLINHDSFRFREAGLSPDGDPESDYIESSVSLASRLLVEIGQRAIRSWHVEILTSTFSSLESLDKDGLYLRLADLLTVEGTGYFSISPDRIRDIKQFCNAANLRIDDDSDIFLIAAALQGAMGENNNLSARVHKYSIVSKLIDIYRAHLLCKRGNLDSHIEKPVLDPLRKLLNSLVVTSSGKTMMLLNPIELKSESRGLQS